MNIVVDVREHGLVEKIQKMINVSKEEIQIQMKIESLPLGDILIQTPTGNIAACIERKTFADLLASIKDGRYEEQSYRLANAADLHVPLHRIVYMIEGIFSTLSESEEKLVLATMTSVQMFKGFSVWRTSGLQETAKTIVAMAGKIGRDLKKGKVLYDSLKTIQSEHHQSEPQSDPLSTIPTGDSCQFSSGAIESNVQGQGYSAVVKKVKKANLTPENMAEIVLSQIPGISTHTATAIMRTFGTLPQLFRELSENPGCFKEKKILLENGRKINKGCAEKIIEFLKIVQHE
jgi:ERCC4-type nuclease